MKKKFIIILFTISLMLYVFITLFSSVSLGTGKKELENILLIAFPCFMLLFFTISNKNESRKRYLWYYLFAYIVALLGFVFSENRISYITIENIIEREINLIPFKSITTLLKSQYGLGFALYNITGNFLMLVPLSILLPLINDKYQSGKKLMVLLLTIILGIELIQVLFNVGSFDIDDIILNFLGGMLFFVLITNISVINQCVHFIFIEYYSRKLIFKILSFIFAFLSMGMIILYMMLSYSLFLENRVDVSNLFCISDEKTYLLSKDNYRYYSECNYGDSKVMIGNVEYNISDALALGKINEYFDKLKITKQAIVYKVDLIENSEVSFIYYDNKIKMNYYFYNIKDLIYYFDDTKKSLRELLLDETIDFNPVLSLVTLKKIYSNASVTYSEGDFFNLITCNFDDLNNNYVVSKKYVFEESFCKNTGVKSVFW